MITKVKEIEIKEFLIDLDLPHTSSEQNHLVFRNGIAIFLSKNDKGTITVDDKEYDLSGNNIVILPENHIISINSELLQHKSIIVVTIDYILNMPSPIDTNIFSFSRYLSVIKVSDEKFEDLMSYYQFLQKENLDEGKYKDEIIRSIFYALILEITSEYEKIFTLERGNIKAENLTDRFFKLLATHYKQHRSVQYYADRLSLTPKYLSTAVKRATGRPILEWIHEAILIESKMLLRTTNLTIQQITDQLNFSSPSAFVQFIKKQTGKTPRELK